jgi:negative regulator of sigma-B (phosphoserine phosphatase)
MSPLCIGAAQRPMRGLTVCGDAFRVMSIGENTLIAIADGSGHGPEAAVAATLFCETAMARGSEPLPSILQAAHLKLRSTAGAAGALLTVNCKERLLHFAGIGDIILRGAGRTPVRAVSLPGMLGHRLHRTRMFHCECRKGDLYLLHTDGISSRFELASLPGESVQSIADSILARHGKVYDDATCLVLRWQDD